MDSEAARRQVAHLLSYSGGILGITHRHVSVVVLGAGRPQGGASSSRPAVPLGALPPEGTPAFLSSLRETNSVIVLWGWKQRANEEMPPGGPHGGHAPRTALAVSRERPPSVQRKTPPLGDGRLGGESAGLLTNEAEAAAREAGEEG